MKWRLLGLFLLLLAPATLLAQQGDHRAGLVIQYGDGRVVDVCVPFNEPSITGEELLRRANLPVVAQSSGMGAAVCQIDGEGCNYPQQPCFCQCQGADCAYWTFHQQVDNGWRYLSQGASSVDVRAGDVYGWAWGAGDTSPPVRDFAEICPVAAAPSVAPTTLATASVALPVATILATASVTLPVPTMTPALPASQSVSSYALFGAIALILVVVLFFVRRRSS